MASVSEYGDDVRDTGMTSVERSMPLPADSRVSTRWPSSVPVRMWAVVSDPSVILPSTMNVTSASPSSQRNIADRTNFDARDRHGVPGGEAPGFSEQRLVPHRGRQRDQLFGLQPYSDDEHDQHGTDEAAPNQLPFHGISASGLRAPPALLFDPREYNCASLKIRRPE